MKVFMDAGQLIPNDLTTPFLAKTLSEERFQGGVILDGTAHPLSKLSPPQFSYLSSYLIGSLSPPSFSSCFLNFLLF